MGVTLHFTVLDPPLDVDALAAVIAAVPCVVEERAGLESYRRFHLAGDREGEAELAAGEARLPILCHGSDWVSLSIGWHDNPYGHGAQILDWVLSRHACRAEESEWGERSEDPERAREWMRMWGLAVPPARARIEARAVAWLSDAVIQRIEIRLGQLAVVFVDSESYEDRVALRFESDHPRLSTESPAPSELESDEALVVALMAQLGTPITEASFGPDGGLCLATSSMRLRFLPVWPLREQGWTLTAPGDARVVWLASGNGGALRVVDRSAFEGR